MTYTEAQKQRAQHFANSPELQHDSPNIGCILVLATMLATAVGIGYVGLVVWRAL